MSVQALRFFYKGNKLATLHTGTAQHTVVSANNQNLYETTDQTSQLRLLATDAQDSTVITQSENQATIAYSPYGEDNCPPASPTVSRFTGQSWLPSGIGYLLGNGHRLFNPGMMRFHSPDSLSPFARGGLNAYAYCGNDPINRVDPSGRFFGRLFKRINQGYSYYKLTPRLDEPSPNLSRNEYNALSKSIDKRQLRLREKLNRARKSGNIPKANNAVQELGALAQQSEILGSLSVDTNKRFNFDITPITQALLGDIPAHPGPTSKRAEEILNSPSTIDPSIPEDLVDQDMLERMRRLREG